jgi:uncharacterized protein (TIGR02266 family)
MQTRAHHETPPQPIQPDRRWEERRQHARLDAEFDVTFESEHNFYTGFSEDISEGGIFVATHELRPVGTVSEVHFTLPGIDRPLRVRGEVRWHRRPRAGSNTWPGMGLRFVELEPATRRLIERFVNKREPLFFEE